MLNQLDYKKALDVLRSFPRDSLVSEFYDARQDFSGALGEIFGDAFEYPDFSGKTIARIVKMAAKEVAALGMSSGVGDPSLSADEDPAYWAQINGLKSMTVAINAGHADEKKIQEMRVALQSHDYFVGERDPSVRPEFPGAFIVSDPLDGEDGYAIVGDDLDELIVEAHEHLLETFVENDRKLSNYKDPNEFLLAEYSKYEKDVAEGDPMAFDDWLAGSDLPEIVEARELVRAQERNLSKNSFKGTTPPENDGLYLMADGRFSRYLGGKWRVTNGDPSKAEQEIRLDAFPSPQFRIKGHHQWSVIEKEVEQVEGKAPMLTPSFEVGQRFDFKPGEAIVGNGYRGTVIKVLDGQLEGMVEVRLPGGVGCLSSSFPDCFPAFNNGVEVVTEGRFIGSVKEASGKFVVQDAGRGRLVAHERHRFEDLPAVGDVVDLQHRAGKVVFVVEKDKGRGNER